MKFNLIIKTRLYFSFSLVVNFYACNPFSFYNFTPKIIKSKFLNRMCFTGILFYQQLIYFLEIARYKLTYFQLPFIINSLVDLKLFIIIKTCEFNLYNNGGWAHIDLSTCNLSYKCTAPLSSDKNLYISFWIFRWSSARHFSFSSLTFFNR